MTKKSKGTIVEKVLTEIQEANKLPYPDPSGRAKFMYCPNPNCGQENPPYDVGRTDELQDPAHKGFVIVSIMCAKCGIIMGSHMMRIRPPEPKEKEESLILTRTN